MSTKICALNTFLLVLTPRLVGESLPFAHGGESANDSKQLVPALLEAASAVLDREISAVKRKELASLEFHYARIKMAKKSEPSNTLEGETEGISDYESPPEYDF
ncbi:unnamed protein product [Linum trigynum]|uniref:Uncharacterized protein n=1 Tax=Linum trigynum TaxID=586398 RepID=A0AAV2F580_9ROSI